LEIGRIEHRSCRIIDPEALEEKNVQISDFFDSIDPMRSSPKGIFLKLGWYLAKVPQAPMAPRWLMRVLV